MESRGVQAYDILALFALASTSKLVLDAWAREVMRAAMIPIALGKRFRVSENVPQLDKLDRRRDFCCETVSG